MTKSEAMAIIDKLQASAIDFVRGYVTAAQYEAERNKMRDMLCGLCGTEVVASAKNTQEQLAIAKDPYIDLLNDADAQIDPNSIVDIRKDLSSKRLKNT